MPDIETHDRELIFVYNADTGLFNTMADIGHKIFSPQTYKCDLCMLTHGYFSERGEWREFIENLPLGADFLHRDEFHKAYGKHEAGLPALFLDSDGVAELFMSHEEINACGDLQSLMGKMDAKQAELSK